MPLADATALHAALTGEHGSDWLDGAHPYDLLADRPADVLDAATAEVSTLGV